MKNPFEDSNVEAQATLDSTLVVDAAYGPVLLFLN